MMQASIRPKHDVLHLMSPHDLGMTLTEVKSVVSHQFGILCCLVNSSPSYHDNDNLASNEWLHSIHQGHMAYGNMTAWQKPLICIFIR